MAIEPQAESQALTVVDPKTAEIVAVRTASVDTLAELIGNVKELEAGLRAMKRVVNAELHRRMDEGRHWTIDGKRWRVTSTSPEPTTRYDADRLDAILRAWVRQAPDAEAEGMRESARQRAIEVEVTRKARIGAVNAILKGADEELRRLILDCAYTEERDRYPKVQLR